MQNAEHAFLWTVFSAEFEASCASEGVDVV